MQTTQKTENQLLKSRHLIFFGILLTFFSGFGQTFFISLFSAELRETFSLSNGEFGTVYSLGTLTSALCLTWVGKKIDEIPLRWYSTFVCIGAILGTLLMASVASVFMLYLTIFLLRLSCQGLMGHTAMTTMARYFDEKFRGKAISIAGIGHPISEGLFPLMAVMVVGAIGWRQAWASFSLCILVVAIPLVWYLLSQSMKVHQLKSEVVLSDNKVLTERQYTRLEVLKDKRFYLILPGLLAPPFLVTGILFLQVQLVDAKAWKLEWFASMFIFLAISRIGASLMMGVLVDRFGSLRLMRYFLWPFIVSIFLLAYSDAITIAAVFMVGTGLTMGASSVIFGALWPELYGIRHLGAIRSMVTALAVFSTAVAPILMGYLLDWGMSMQTLLFCCFVYVLVSMLPFYGVKKEHGKIE